MARREDIDNFISNPDGISNYEHGGYSKKVYDNDRPKFVKEESSSSKTVKENVRVEETQQTERVEKLKQHSAFSRKDSIIRKPDITFSVSNAVAAVGSTAAAVAVTVAVAVVLVVAALSLNVSLVSATANTLSFFVDIQNDDGKTFTATLSQGDYSVAYDLTESDYLTFSDLTPDSEYNFRVIDKESGEEYFNQNFCTLKNDNDRVKIVATLSGDNLLTFTLTVADLRRDEFYTVEVTDASGKQYLIVDDTVSPRTFVVQLDDVPDAYITISINGRYALLAKQTKTHNFGEPVFNWTETDDGYAVNVLFTDLDNSDYTKQVAATVTPNKTPATCETDGQIVYTATAEFEGKTYTDTTTIPLTAFGHDYRAVFNWTTNVQGGQDATATLTCQHDNSHVVADLTAVVTEQVFEATCDEGSRIIYTATVTYGGNEYTDTNTVSTGDALGHLYTDEPEWEWTDTGTVDGEGIPVYTAVAVFTCSRCGETMRMNGGDYSYEGGLPTCDDPGTIILYARVTYEGDEHEGQKELSFPALGHDWGEPQWTWNEIGDGAWTATLQFVCANDPAHVQTPEVTVTPTTIPATCEEAETITYTATAMFEGVEYTDQKTVEGESAHGHDYSGEPEWEWTDTGEVDGEGFPIYQAVAVFTCKKDATHTNRVVCEEISHEGGLPGCEDSGLITYYASLDYNNSNYQDEHQVTLPALGHSYIPVFSWMAVQDEYQADLYIVCERGDSHIGPITAVVTSSAQNGYTLYTATATYDNAEYTETKKVVDENTSKALAVGVNYYIGDTIEVGANTVYFADDYSPRRSNLSGSTYLDSVLRAGETGGVTFSSGNENVLNYDRIILNNGTYARANDDGSIHGLGYEEMSWIFTASDNQLIGVTVASGTGTDDDPYILTPIYGATVTYNANGGLFTSIEDSTLTRYSVGASNYVIPPAENPDQAGMLFLGWFTDDSGQNKFDFENTPITEDITLYAGWIAIE